MYSIWTDSYIVSNGKKIYLETMYHKLDEQMKYGSSDMISVTVSGIVFGKKMKVKRSSITEYGEAGIV